MSQNIYQRLGLKRVINACGKMTILGVSAVSPEVMAATAEAAGAFVEIDALVDRTGELVSTHTGAQDKLYNLLRVGGDCHCGGGGHHAR